MARQIDLDQLMKYPLRRGNEHCDEKNADPRFLNGVESILEWAQTLPTLTPQNDPLTVEELREMDGEQVWVMPLGFWALVIAKPGKRVQLMSNDGETVWADKEIELVGPVYRRPPEGEEDT